MTKHSSDDVRAFTVRAATTEDLPALGDVLARAFLDDPVMGWLFPDESGREHRLSTMFRVLASQVHFRNGGTDVAVTEDGGMLGATMWDPPDTWHPAKRIERLGQWVFVRGIGGKAGRLGALMRALDAVHPSEPHWYLGQIGTDPDVQGIGVGGALLRNRLGTCDELGIGAYLESSKQTNIGYYERFGFRRTGEILVRDSPSVYPMWRDPDPDVTRRA